MHPGPRHYSAWTGGRLLFSSAGESLKVARRRGSSPGAVPGVCLRVCAGTLGSGEAAQMAENGKAHQTVIKKYANRRLYHTGTSTYVTLEDLATMVQNGEDFVVYDARSGDDIPHSVLTQISFDQENKAGDDNLLPVAF